MWADQESQIDFVNYEETSELIYELVTNPILRPVSIGIFGGWGAGKSTLLSLTRVHIANADNFILVDFDAWLYQDFDDARSALLEIVSSRLLAEAKSSQKAVDKAKSIFKRVNKLRVLGLIAEGGAAMMGAPAFGLINKGIASLSEIASGNGEEKDIEAVQSAASSTGKTVAGLIEPKQDVVPTEEITEFREEFAALLKEMNKTLVVCVDNLDRCLPKNAIQTLEAIRLILFMPNTAFIVAADEDMIKLAVSEHYNTNQSRLVSDYLDKLIQVPVYVPQLGVAEVTTYTFALLCTAAEISESVTKQAVACLQDSLRGLWKKPLMSANEILTQDQIAANATESEISEIRKAYTLASRLAPMLTASRRISGNPRIIKRLLNTVWMRARIAQKRQMPHEIDKALLAKISLFERCSSAKAVTEFYRLINEANDGKPGAIALLEEKKNFAKTDLPAGWEDIEFIESWLELEPKLSNVDLRAVAYLARETLPMAIATEGLSANAEKYLLVLAKSTKISSPSLKTAIADIPAEECSLVMDALLNELRKTTSWIKIPPGFVGAIALARKSPEASELLKSFIMGFKEVPKWMSVQIKDDPWWKQED